MPTYVYHCDQCDNDFEAVQKFSDEDLRQCPLGHETVRRVFTPAGIIFKGSGWYIKDSKSNGDSSSTKRSKSSANGNGDASKSSESSANSDAKNSDVKSSESNAETASESKATGKADAPT